MSDHKNVLVDLGQLTEPARILTERTCDAVGGWLRPRQMRRIAKAEADVKLIETQSGIDQRRLLDVAEINDRKLGERTLKRFVEEEVKKQVNMEEVLSQAIDKLSSTAKPGDIEADFLTDAMAKCRNISNSKMQSMWASIIANEANQPGSVSKRTLHLLSTLDRRDAELFQKFSQAIWHVNRAKTAIVTPLMIKAMAGNGLNFENLSHLETLGLIRIVEGTSTYEFSMENSTRTATKVEISGKEGVLIVDFIEPMEKVAFNVGNIMLTRTGHELSDICDAEPNDQYFQIVVEHLMKSNRLIYSPFPRHRNIGHQKLPVTN